MNEYASGENVPQAAPSGTCHNCKTRPASVIWVGEGGVLAYVHGISAHWCRHCAVEAQLKHAREQAAQIPDLEKQLAELP